MKKITTNPRTRKRNNLDKALASNKVAEKLKLKKHSKKDGLKPTFKPAVDVYVNQCTDKHNQLDFDWERFRS